AAVSDAEHVARPHTHERFENGTTGEYEIGAVAADAGLAHARFVAAREQIRADRTHLTRAEPAAVHAIAVVAGKAQVDAGDGRHRAGRAEHVHAAIVHARAEAVLAFEGREEVGHE